MVPATRAELALLLDDLERIFGDRLMSVVAYGRQNRRPIPSLVDDLASCASRAGIWHRNDAATPLILTREEFSRSADAFPIEYAEMHETAAILHGVDPFAIYGGARRDDLRRACEVQVRSHLLHLREDYMECRGRAREVAALVSESARGFAVLLRHYARLEGESPSTPGELSAFATRHVGLEAHAIDDILALTEPAKAGTVDAARTFPVYLSAVEHLAHLVDRWRARPEPIEGR
jgi:hypothetical protein